VPNRIVLVGMALRTVDRQTKNALPDRVHPIEHRLHPKLFRIDSTLFVDHRVAQKTGCDESAPASDSGRRSPAICSMMRTVVWFIAVERVDHPVAIEPGPAHLVLLITIRVGVPRRIEPESSPALTVVRGGEQPLDLPAPGLRTLIGEEGVDLRRCRRQTRQVETQSSQERLCDQPWTLARPFSPAARG
jgi:hypothetical protein